VKNKYLLKRVLRREIILSAVTTCVSFILLLVLTKDIDATLIVTIAIFLSSLMWVFIYYRNPERGQRNKDDH
jgi:hypothetical protein